MSTVYRVRQGDSVASIAYEQGYFPGTLWDDPDNADLRRRRRDPEVLLAGDELIIRDMHTKNMSAETGKIHVFRRRAVPRRFSVRLLLANEPVANASCTVEIDASGEQRACTDADGWLFHYAAPNSSRAVIRLEDGSEYRIDIGQIDPIDTMTGIQGRLRSLGLYQGTIDGAASPATSEAIREFQRRTGLAITGECDAETAARLQKGAGR